MPVDLVAANSPARVARPDTPADEGLRTFTLARTSAVREDDVERAPRIGRSAESLLPVSRGTISSTLGLGYVQHADFGAEALASGTMAGLDLQLDSLVTYGYQGARFDHGTLSLRDADAGWHAEAGDLFSDLRGPVRGARLSWHLNAYWQPSLSITRPLRTATDQRTLLIFRDRVQAGPVGVDGEVASDGSHFLRTRLAVSHVDVETSYRRARLPAPLRDLGVQAGVRVWRGVAVSAGWFQSDRFGERSEWRSFGLHVPVFRGVGLTLERNFAITGQSSDASSAAMVTVAARQFMFFHRYQWGHADFLQPGGVAGFDRQQLQAMASYAPGPRVNVALQVASQWSPLGRTQNWLELETTLRLTRRTNLQVASPLPESFDAARVRVRLEQGLPRRFALLAEYGRPSAYQDMPDGLEQPRFKIMLRKTWDVRTPVRGGTVRGLVVDYTGRPVPGAGVRLGPYATDTDANGAYLFTQVPRGAFDLSLDPDLLPADFAWDGRARAVVVQPSSRIAIDLVVAPLNAIHGRVYADRNGNGRFDAGEAVAGAVLRLDDHVTATDANGAYDFYNVLPGVHIVRLDRERLPVAFDIADPAALTVELREDRPVTGADFIVTAKLKPVIWKDIK